MDVYHKEFVLGDVYVLRNYNGIILIDFLDNSTLPQGTVS
jgi:hypothetical protein